MSTLNEGYKDLSTSVYNETNESFKDLPTSIGSIINPSGDGLKENNKYKLQIRYKDYEKNITFYTKLKPLYASVYQVRSMPIKNFIKKVEDEEIRFQIYENSKLAERIAKDNDNEFNKEDPPYYVMSYVIAKTKYDIFLNVYLDLASRSAKDIKLADFEVENGNMDSLKDLLEMLKDEVEEKEKKLKGLSKAKPKSVLKSEGDRDYSFEIRKEF